MIQIEKINELHLRIDGDRDELYNINQHFSFYKDGYKYSPQYKAGIWDGKIRLFDLKKKILPIGLLVQLLKYCKENKTKIDFTNKQELKPIDYSDRLEEYLNKMGDYTNYTFTGKYAFQYPTIKHAIEKQKAIIVSPTACLDENTEIEVLLDEYTLKLLQDIRNE